MPTGSFAVGRVALVVRSSRIRYSGLSLKPRALDWIADCALQGASQCPDRHLRVHSAHGVHGDTGSEYDPSSIAGYCAGFANALASVYLRVRYSATVPSSAGFIRLILLQSLHLDFPCATPATPIAPVSRPFFF